MKKVLKISLKIILSLLSILILGFVILYVVYDSPLPTIKENSNADALAQKMLKALNQEAYQNTQFIEWTFLQGKHYYKWDKLNAKVEVQWKSYTVNLNLNNTAKSIVLDNNTKLLGPERSKLIQTATSYFNNDSFWLVAPYKIFDKGSKRAIVQLEDGTEGLMITYTSGGDTPGDSYVWKLGPTAFPESYRMWVEIIPIGGLEASWENWQVMESGIFLPTLHKLGPIDLRMEQVRAYN